MPRKIDPIKEARGKEINKLLRAATILDIHLSNYNNLPAKDTPQFTCTRSLKKSRSLNPYTSVTTRATFWNVDAREYSYPTRSYITKPAMNSIHISWLITDKVNCHIRNTDTSKDLGCYNETDRTVTITTITDEDIEWAKVVLKNTGIDLTGFRLEGYQVNLYFQTTFTMQTSKPVWVKSKEDAEKLQQDIISGEVKIDFPISSFGRVPDPENNSHVIKGEQLTAVPIL